ncbi:hypothetical protein BKA82DRAFT_4189048 [Pisolithus tinctorius]|nr:hypothetical protein BKA82DRAFT_4189048 [Pisolithus tinctorius]
MSIYLFWSANDTDYGVRVCKPLMLYDSATIVVVQVICGVVMIMRVYALYERSRCVLALLLWVAVCGIVVGGWAFSSLPSTPPAVLAPTQAPSIGYVAAAWSGQLLFDALVFGLTLWRSVYSRTPRRRSITDVLLRDGAVMSAANLGNIIALLDNVKNIADSFTSIISATMISRLMLNLRDPSIAGPAVAAFPPLSHPSAFATTRGLPGTETTTTEP